MLAPVFQWCILHTKHAIVDMHAEHALCCSTHIHSMFSVQSAVLALLCYYELVDLTKLLVFQRNPHCFLTSIVLLEIISCLLIVVYLVSILKSASSFLSHLLSYQITTTSCLSARAPLWTTGTPQNRLPFTGSAGKNIMCIISYYKSKRKILIVLK